MKVNFIFLNNNDHKLLYNMCYFYAKLSKLWKHGYVLKKQ